MNHYSMDANNINTGRTNEGFTYDQEFENTENGLSNVKSISTAKRSELQIESNDIHCNGPSSSNSVIVRILLKTFIHIIIGAYFAYATYYYINIENKQCLQKNFNTNGTTVSRQQQCHMKFCNGYGFLILMLGFIYFGLFYYKIFKPKYTPYLKRKYLIRVNTKWDIITHQRKCSLLLLIVLLIFLIVFLYFETRHDISKLSGLVCPSLCITACYWFSSRRKAIQWRIVVKGLVCQFVLAIICLRWDIGRSIFKCIGEKVATFLEFADVGSRFVYGNGIVDESIFAFVALSVIFFFSFFISILYYLNVMQWIIMIMGWTLQMLLGTTVCESVTAAANIFLGMSESPLLIRPYIQHLTTSEFHSIMVSGFATVSGTVLAAYLKFGAVAAHLLTASVMAAPASLAISKLLLPEVENSKTTSDNIKLEKTEDSSILDAASSGATGAIQIVLGIIANIIAFVAFIACINSIFNWLGILIGLDDIDFEWFISKLFIPLAWSMGIPWHHCTLVAKVIAKKILINEFVAYELLGSFIKADMIDNRSAAIATFSICGFANPSSLGILIAALSSIAPNRKTTITAVAFRAFIAGNIVSCMSASYAGLLIDEIQV